MFSDSDSSSFHKNETEFEIGYLETVDFEVVNIPILGSFISFVKE